MQFHPTLRQKASKFTNAKKKNRVKLLKDGDPRKVDGGRKKMQINDIKKKKTMIFGQRDRGSLGDPALTRIPDRALAHFWIPVESNSKKNPGDPKNVRPCRCRLFLFLRMISLLCFFFSLQPTNISLEIPWHLPPPWNPPTETRWRTKFGTNG